MWRFRKGKLKATVMSLMEGTKKTSKYSEKPRNIALIVFIK